jgi:hypothetical protein
MIKDVSRISLVYSFTIFQARNDPVWFSPCLVTRRGANRWVSRETLGEAPSPRLPLPPKKRKKRGSALLLLFSFLLYWHIAKIPRWVWSCIVAVLGLAVVLHLAVVVFAPPASVQDGWVYWPQSGFQGFPDSCRKLWAHKLWCILHVYVLDRHVCILYKFMFYIYNRVIIKWDYPPRPLGP